MKEKEQLRNDCNSEEGQKTVQKSYKGNVMGLISEPSCLDVGLFVLQGRPRHYGVGR
jgi:hypothetical protein